jgi:FOG: WD40-like repeat
MNAGVALASFKGQVFLDKNGNHHLDAGEKGIANVAVSDGLNVVLTNANGSYDLPGTPKTRHIFITVPSGYQASDSHYLKVDGENTSYNFGLIPFEPSKNGDARFLHLADTENTEDGGWISPIREYAVNQKASFIIHTGDICYERGLNFHGRNLTSKTMGVPTYYCIGNHDLVKGKYGEELFEKNFGPTYYSFDAGNTHFVVTPMLGGDYMSSYTKEDVYRWLVNDIKLVPKSKNLVVFNHDLLTYGDDFSYGISSTEKINLNEHNLKAWIYGHWHINYLKKHGNTGIVSVCASTPDKGGIDHSPSNFIVYEISKDGKFTAAPRYNYLKNQLAATSLVDTAAIRSGKGAVQVAASCYSTASPTKEVSCRIESGTETSKWFSLSPQTDWSWKATIPLNLSEGVARNAKLRVCAKFDNGDVVSRCQNLAPNENQKLKLSWMSNCGGNIYMCSPVCSNGKIFEATTDEFSRKSCCIVAFDAKSGKLLWKHSVGGSIKNTICVEDGKVLATDEDGIAYAINAETGELVWKRELGMTYLGSFISGTVARDGIYYTGFGSYLSALSVKDGSLIWKNEGWSGGEGTTSTHSIAGSTLITGSNWQALFGHDIATGKVKWKHSDNGLRFRSGTAAYIDDTLYAIAEKSLIKMNPDNGSIYSVNPTSYNLQVATTPLVTSGSIIMGTANGGMVSFNRGSMAEQWKVNVGPALIYTSPYTKPYSATVETAPLLIGNLICFGASDGFLYLVDSRNGNVEERMELGSPIFGKVCSDGNSIYVADFAGNVYCFELN